MSAILLRRFAISAVQKLYQDTRCPFTCNSKFHMLMHLHVKMEGSANTNTRYLNDYGRYVS
jgi:hypothetical protein